MIQHMEKVDIELQLQNNTSNSEHGSNSTQEETNNEAEGEIRTVWIVHKLFYSQVMNVYLQC